MDADFVFGRLDHDPTCLRLLDRRAEGDPTSISTDTGEDGDRPWYGGREVFSFAGRGCLSCRRVLDQRALARAGMTPQQREKDDRSYGVAAWALAGTGPSVNGFVASFGVSEFAVWATGLREPWPELTYRGYIGIVRLSADRPRSDCV